MNRIKNLEDLCKLQNKNTQLMWGELQKLKQEQQKPKKRFKFSIGIDKSKPNLSECKSLKCSSNKEGYCTLKNLEVCEERTV